MLYVLQVIDGGDWPLFECFHWIQVLIQVKILIELKLSLPLKLTSYASIPIYHVHSPELD